MNLHDKVVNRTQRRITIILALRYAVQGAVIWSFSWGLASLVLRAGFDFPQEYLVWGLAGFAAILLPGFILALRRTPPASVIRALLDQHSRCGGLLMADRETDIGSWLSAMPAVDTPSIRWHGRRWLALWGAGCLFACVSILLPSYYTQTSFAGRLKIGDLVDDLKARIDVLEERDILEKEKAAEISEKLSDIWTLSSGTDPLKTWEALDHMDKILSDAAKEAAASLAQEAQKLSELQALCDALQGLNSENSPDAKELGQAMQELASMMAGATSGSELSELMNKLQAQAGAGMNLQPGDLAKLSEALRQCQGQCLGTLDKLCQGKMIDQTTLDKYKQGASQNPDDVLADFLAKNEESALASCLGACGNGGISRGRGDAPMTWKNETSELNANLKEQSLSPGKLRNMQSRVVGLSASAPQEQPAGVAVEAGTLSQAAEGGGAAYAHTILPKHRNTVKQYFERGSP